MIWNWLGLGGFGWRWNGCKRVNNVCMADWLRKVVNWGVEEEEVVG